MEAGGYISLCKFIFFFSDVNLDATHVPLEDLFEDFPLSLYTSLYTVVMDVHFVLCCDDTDGYGSIYVFNFDPDDGSLLF